MSKRQNILLTVKCVRIQYFCFFETVLEQKKQKFEYFNFINVGFEKKKVTQLPSIESISDQRVAKISQM